MIYFITFNSFSCMGDIGVRTLLLGVFSSVCSPGIPKFCVFIHLINISEWLTKEHPYGTEEQMSKHGDSSKWMFFFLFLHVCWERTAKNISLLCYYLLICRRHLLISEVCTHSQLTNMLTFWCLGHLIHILPLSHSLSLLSHSMYVCQSVYLSLFTSLNPIFLFVILVSVFL